MNGYDLLIASQTMTNESEPQLLQRLGTDAAKWAAEFRKTALKLGYSDMDEGWLIGWFANAIESRSTARPIRSEDIIYAHPGKPMI